MGVCQREPRADHGVATATAFGVLMLIATLPGAIVVVAGIVRRRAASEPASTFDRHLVGARNG
jgi:hypothetical protein